MPAHVLGDAPPPPRRLRRAVLFMIAGAVGSGVVAVNTIPVVSHTWAVVSHQTDLALAHVLGKAELQTAQMLSGNALADETAVNSPLH